MSYSEYTMINVADKTPTQRTCLASGKLIAHPQTIARIKAGDLPKGNVLPLAEAAGIMAVKRTSDVLPLCHPLPIDAAAVRFEFSENFVQVFCETTAFAKTGVEMEALNGVNAALLCIYDLTKGIDPTLELTDIHLQKKSGGKSGDWTHPKSSLPLSAPTAPELLWKNISFSVITLSDRCARGEAEDTSGPAMISFAQTQGAELITHQLIPDDSTQLKNLLLQWCETGTPHLILCTGGTGVGPRDLTPETIQSLGGKLIPGFGELCRKEGSTHTPYAWLSRTEAFLLKRTLVIALPGSKKAVQEGLQTLLKLIPHAVHTAQGGDHS